jgi:DNA-binding LacI/PurR family transcriptional regulator
MPEVTLLELSRRLNLSKSSVSVALRGKPGVSEEIRARVLEEARRLGYRPNPVATELMALLRTRRQAASGHTVGFINTFQDPSWMERLPTFRAFIEGAREAAEYFGYQFEVFQAYGEGMTPRRLDQVLKARGIRGLLVGPRWMNEPELPIDWNAFSCVLVGEARHCAGIYRVCNHHVYSTALTLRRLAERGYRRIGLTLIRGYESVRGHDYLVGLDEAKRELGDRVTLFSDLPAQWDEARFARWVQTERLDAVVSLTSDPAECVRRLRTIEEEPIGYANLDVQPGTNWAGIDQHSIEIGKTSMDLLRTLLHAGERGTTPRPRIVLIEGEWVEGETVRAAAPGDKRRRRRTPPRAGRLM